VFAANQSTGWLGFDKSMKKESKNDKNDKNDKTKFKINDYERIPLFWGSTQFLLLGENKNRKIDLYPMNKV
jgi:hypothetical protein